MNPNDSSDLYPAGYLAFVESIVENFLDSVDNPDNPSEFEFDVYMEGLRHDVMINILRKGVTFK